MLKLAWKDFPFNEDLSDISIVNLDESDKPEILSIEAGEEQGHTSNVLEYIQDNVNWDMSVKAMQSGVLIGYYLLSDNPISSIEDKGVKYFGNLDEYKDKHGVEGVSLYVKPEYRKLGVASLLKDYGENTGSDYVWGYQSKYLNNIDHWMKRRDYFADTGKEHVTVKDLDTVPQSTLSPTSNLKLSWREEKRTNMNATGAWSVLNIMTEMGVELPLHNSPEISKLMELDFPNILRRDIDIVISKYNLDIQVLDISFEEIDSLNISHASAYYVYELVCTISETDELSKAIEDYEKEHTEEIFLPLITIDDQYPTTASLKLSWRRPYYDTINENEYGGRFYYDDDKQLHREDDLPAIEYPQPHGLSEWHQHGKLHRDNDLPAVIHGNGTKEWYTNNTRNREDGKPAVEKANGTKEWFLNGKRHRTDGPAIEYDSGGDEYSTIGRRLVEMREGDVSYYINGRHYLTEDTWKNARDRYRNSTANLKLSWQEIPEGGNEPTHEIVPTINDILERATLWAETQPDPRRINSESIPVEYKDELFQILKEYDENSMDNIEDVTANLKIETSVDSDAVQAMNLIEATFLEEYDTIIFDLDGNIWDVLSDKGEGMGAYETAGPYTLESRDVIIDSKGNVIQLHKGISEMLDILDLTGKNLGIMSRGEVTSLPFEAQPSTQLLKKFEIYKYFNYEVIYKAFGDKSAYVRPRGKTLFIDDDKKNIDSVESRGDVDVLWRKAFNNWLDLLSIKENVNE